MITQEEHEKALDKEWNTATNRAIGVERANFYRLIEDERIAMKETHACRFNDGKQNCECYLQALDAVQKKLEQGL